MVEYGNLSKTMVNNGNYGRLTMFKCTNNFYSKIVVIRMIIFCYNQNIVNYYEGLPSGKSIEFNERNSFLY